MKRVLRVAATFAMLTAGCSADSTQEAAPGYDAASHADDAATEGSSGNDAAVDPDGEKLDAASVDGSANEGGSAESGATDGGVVESGVPEASAGETGVPDAGEPEASGAEASAPDGGAPVDGGLDAPAAFLPTNLAGLVLWLRADQGVASSGMKVSQWQDQSPSSLVVAQSNAASQPLIDTIGTHPVVSFAAGTWLDAPHAAVGAALDFGVGDLLVEVVFAAAPKTQGLGSLGGILYKGPGPSSPWAGLQVYGNLAGNGVPGAGLNGTDQLLTATGANTMDGTLHQLGLRRQGTSLTLRYDGVEVATKDVGDATNVDSSELLLVGGRPNGLHPFVGVVGDIMVVKGTLTALEIGELEAYLAMKYELWP